MRMKYTGKDFSDNQCLIRIFSVGTLAGHFHSIYGGMWGYFTTTE